VSARDDVLARVRAALGPDAAGGGRDDIPRAYRGPGRIGPTGAADVVDRFCARVAEYQATVRRIPADGLEEAVAAACRERGARRMGVPSGGPAGIEGVELVVDDPPLPVAELDRLDGVLTGCALAIAETGTIVPDSGE
jgi:L-lactate dehydrogenase complex protein LldG